MHKLLTKKVNIVLSLMLAFTLILVGCTANETKKVETEKAGTESAETDGPVTVTIAYPWGEGAFEERYGPVDEALDDIKLELIPTATNRADLEQLNAKGIIPDIIFPMDFQALQELDMVYPLDDLIEANNYDLSGIEESAIAHIRARDPEGRLTGLPFSFEPFVLFYNKTIFDKFGVPYPGDDLTWKDTLDLARKLTREADGIKYVGLEMGAGSAAGPVTVPLKEFAINLTDPKTGDVHVGDEPEIARYYQLIEQLYDIPGLYDAEFAETGKYAFAEGRAAMLVAWAGYPRWGLTEDMYEQFDVAALPVWEDHAFSPPMEVNQHVIHPLSKHKEAAFKVITQYLSPEHQALMARTVLEGTVLKDKEVALQFGAEHPAYQHDVNIDALYARTPAIPTSQLSYWDRFVSITDVLPKLAEGEDVNEVIRQLKEESEQKILDEKAK